MATMLKRLLFAGGSLFVTLAVYADSLAPARKTASAVKQLPDYRSDYYSIGLSRNSPEFTAFTIDSLGHGALLQNPVIEDQPAVSGLRFERAKPGQFVYTVTNSDGQAAAVWRITCEDKTLVARSEYVPNSAPLPLVLTFDQKANHATLLGFMAAERRMSLPCLLHLPDLGSARITASVPGLELDYDARRKVPVRFVRISFPPASQAHPVVEYRLDITTIYPHWPGVEEARFDGFKRNYLNIFQVNPRMQMLANNAASDPVPFSLYEYAEVARNAPPLAEGVSCLGLVRMTLDRYLGGTIGYGQVGYHRTPAQPDLANWKSPWTTLDTLPSLLISACVYVDSTRDLTWARQNYSKLAVWAHQMIANDTDGNGLLKYPDTGNYGDRPKLLVAGGPANWWDTINFGHEDAYSNALAYHACREFARLASALGHDDDRAWISGKADKLRAAYVPAFLDPKTGVLAGWRSADGQLHDYWFTFVQGAAITYGLVDSPLANAIMDRLLAKMKEVGFTNFSLGLPGNLVPIHKGDYAVVGRDPEIWGEPRLEDGSDGFQYYENGGATGCQAYFTINALYQLGRTDEARRILFPMLESYRQGNFQGFEASGRSKDWQDWSGVGHGYEGMLVDSYFTLLAVGDEANAR